MSRLKDDDMKKYSDSKRFITWTKVWLTISGIIFISVIVFVAFIYISDKICNTYDTATLGICVTVAGAIFGSNLCWYSKKSASENHYKLRMALFSDSAKVRLEYNEEMMKLMKKYKLTEADISRIDESGDMDEMMSSAIDSVVNELDNTRDDADSPNEIENFG